MSEKKESLWAVAIRGTPTWLFRSRASARAYCEGKITPENYKVSQVKWGPERQKVKAVL